MTKRTESSAGGPAFDLVGVTTQCGVPRSFAHFAKGGNQERLRHRSLTPLPFKMKSPSSLRSLRTANYTHNAAPPAMPESAP
jgi:hypothetical protein